MDLIAEKDFAGRLGVGAKVEDGGCIAVLTRNERRLLEHIARVQYGRIERIRIQCGQPLGGEEAVKQVRYDTDAT